MVEKKPIPCPGIRSSPNARIFHLRRDAMRLKRRLEWTVDAIRPACTFDVSCQGTVPAALVAFLDADSYEDAVAMPYPTVATATPWPASPAASPRRFMAVSPPRSGRQAQARLPPALWQVVEAFERRY